ncbi:c-type cytochrome [Guyparkeria hydrothermalis]|uniref:c-type cytochrome n=1 Tax=Guyparkeria hydrothermalis TaxID=923 RepID=UPI002021BC34|nr:c-type cytochrome [Guyparkeria hydrothermalis]MCL7743751.1 c-type cytochrome [Guyparkeria hydrothermalis]
MTRQTENPEEGQSTAVRIALAVAGAGLLLGAGLLADHYDVWPFTSTSVTSDETPTTLADRASREAREQLAESRKELAENGDAAFPQVPLGNDNHFVPPDDSEIPNGKMGDAIRRGRSVFVNTGTRAAEFTGNDLACANCHLDSGRRQGSAPLWAAWGVYPKHRGKNDMVNTMEDRIRGCFTYSMNAPQSPNGGPPPANHQIYKDLQSYMFWLADGAPVGQKLPGRSYPKLERTDKGFDYRRGEKVFKANCAVCHGLDGQGQKDLNGRQVFPPLWGPGAYNWGAGMHRVPTAAEFIKANMPLGKRNYLSDQEAWDVAAYINSFPRPPDPRQVEENISVAEARDAYHKDKKGYYGHTLRGKLLGESFDQAQWERFRQKHLPTRTSAQP